MNNYDFFWTMQEQYEEGEKSLQELEDDEDAFNLLVPDDFGDKD